MPITSLTGKEFVVKIATIDYSGQVTQGTITRASNSEVIQTLDGKATVSIGSEDSASIAFLYDQDAGIYDALQDAAGTGAAVALEIRDSVSKWTGSMVVTGCSVDYSASGAVTASADFLGSLTFATV
jgi:hypothetical protein